MIPTPHSMSGYGRGVRESEQLRVTIELRSVNHRFLDLSFKLPRVWMALEQDLAGVLRERLGRGRVEVFARREQLGTSGSEAKIDLGLAQSIQSEAARLAERLGLDDSLGVSDLLRMPGVVTACDAPVDVTSEGPQVLGCLEDAVSALEVMRSAEGARLVGDLNARLTLVADHVTAIEDEAAAVPAMILSRIRRRVDELLEALEVDPDRLAQEAALLADKAGVDEEITRLRAHVAASADLLALAEPVGRRLEFLIQEMNRETNTIGSKSASTVISGRVVELKSEIERIREQVANLE
jgi:uncharacterized protein (TIGR00255 family)